MTMETIVLRPEEDAAVKEDNSPPAKEVEDEKCDPVESDNNHNEASQSQSPDTFTGEATKGQLQSDENPEAFPEEDASEVPTTDDNDSEAVEDGDYTTLNGDGSVDEDLAGLEDLPLNASLHAADEMKKRLEEIDPCEKLRSLCKKGEVDELADFLKNRGETGVDIDYISSDGWTCLHEIITHGCQFTSVAKVLLDHGAKVNTTDFNLDTPLHASLLYHNTENTRLLLQNGADLELANAKGRKPIHNANDLESLELLLDAGGAINSKDGNGNTPLHYAVMAKDTDRVKLLVDRKCDIKAANNSGSTALHLASDPEVARILLDGIQSDELADTVNAVDNSGNSPLHLAVRGRHRDTVRLLVSKSGLYDLTNSSGKSPMSLAKDKEMKGILLKRESSPPSGFTALSSKKAKNLAGPGVQEGPIVLPGNTALQSPSILKRKRHQCVNGIDERTGTRLRFSDVIDYSGVEVEAPKSKRVRAAPLYTEPDFSSDDNE